MTINGLLKNSVRVLVLSAVALNTQGASTSIATAPLTTSSDTAVHPNVMFVLDDSGSMGDNFLPDWAQGAATPLFTNSRYNGLAYNPAILYRAPTYYTAAGALDTTTYPSMTGTTAATGANTGSGLPNWKAVKKDGYGIQSTSTSDLTGSASFYTFVAGEYCTTPGLRTCVAATAPSVSYPEPAYLRWCSNTALTNCQAVWIGGTFDKPRYPGLVITPWKAAKATLTVTTAVNSMTISSIKVNSVEIMSGSYTAPSSSTTASTVATGIAGKITANGFTASVSSAVITITAPATLGNITVSPAPTNSAGTLTPAAFSGGVDQVAVPGSNVQTSIVSTTTSYPYPGTSTTAAARSDCAGSTCTYAEEMTNYANWSAYYDTRMQMMKTAASGAFQPIGDTYRVGMFTISVGSTVTTGTNFLNASEFGFPQKKNWYDKLFASNPSSYTPLRGALAKAGKYFANKLTGQVDPMQFSCQQNFTILSTDGYWNTQIETSTYGPYKLDGTHVGNADGLEPRPFSDGASVTYTKSTSQIQQTQGQALKSTSQAQSQTTQIQKRTVQVQKRTQRFRKCTSLGSGSSGWGTCTDISFDCSSGTGDSTFCRAGSDSGWSNTNSCTAGGTNPATFCQNLTDTGWVNAASCSASNPSGGPTVTCQTTLAVLVNIGTCTPSSSGGQTVTCQVASDSGWGNTASCSASNPPAGPTVTCQTPDPGWVNAASCTSSGPTGGRTINCQITDTGSVMATGGVCTQSGPTGGMTVTCPVALTTGPDAVASCTTALATSANNYTRTTCGTNTISASTPVASCTPVTAAASNGYTATTCSTATTGPNTVSSCAAAPASSLNDWTATTCGAVINSGGNSDTLADVAEYYYVTDLRTSALGNCTGSTGNTLCSTTAPDPNNNVPTSGLDGASWQHMTTFTLGLGASGYMQFSPTYMKDTSGDFADVKNGTTANPAGGICTWQSAGSTCNWTTPASDAQTNIDDLWHAAVNGRGTYFSATDPSTLSAGLSTALSGVSARLGASAAATTSNPNITSGDNFVFSSTFTSNDWDGQLVRQQLDLTTGVTSATIDWSARNQLDTLDWSTRKIYTFSSGATNNLKDFTFSSLGADQSKFTTPQISTSPPTGMTGLSQFCASGATCLSSASQADASGEKLVNFLRGDSSNEGASTDPSKYYHVRTHRLGDIVNAEAVYVKASLFTYADAGYMGTGGFAEANNSRAGRVYAAANDGMLHAFDANNGAEAWAYVPALVLPNVYKLADKDYSNQHTYYLDGTPVAGDICPTAPTTPCTGSTWKTILVGGLNRGGRGYYALDVTDPAAPKALWEFTDTNMGFTFGNPEITKLKDGTWVVLVTSGYNNIASTSWPGAGDGVGRLYVLNAATGTLIGTAISTGVGDTTTPSGLARIRAYADNAMVDNTALRVYGGDLLGNVWRFDINGDIGAAGKDAQRLVTLYSDTATAGTVPQPITARPEVGDCNGKKMVFVGSGRYLGQTDIDVVPGLQSFYGIKDNLDTTTYANPQASGSGFVNQTLTSTTCPAGASSSVCTTGQSVRTASKNTVNLASDKGWYLNFPDSGERDNTDPTLGLATLAFNTNVPSTSSCEIGGYSYRYFLNYCTGAAVVSVGTSSVVSVRLGNALATRPVLVRLPSNAIVELTRLSDGTTLTSDVPIGSGIAATRRVSWRELTND